MPMGWSYTINKYVQVHLPYYIFVSVLFVMGVFFGALLVNALTHEQIQDLGHYLNDFFLTLGPSEAGTANFIDSFYLHMKWLVLIWILGLSVIGLPFIFILDFLKGVLIGFSVGYLVGQLSWKGVLFVIASVAPQNLIIVPAILVMSVASISFSLFIIRNRFMQQKSGSLSQQFTIYSYISLAMGAVFLCVSVFETFISPILIQWFAPWLIA